MWLFSNQRKWIVHSLLICSVHDQVHVTTAISGKVLSILLCPHSSDKRDWRKCTIFYNFFKTSRSGKRPSSSLAWAWFFFTNSPFDPKSLYPYYIESRIGPVAVVLFSFACRKSRATGFAGLSYSQSNSSTYSHKTKSGCSLGIQKLFICYKCKTTRLEKWHRKLSSVVSWKIGDRKRSFGAGNKVSREKIAKQLKPGDCWKILQN